MKLAAVIFDLDGTLVDSEFAWGVSFKNILKTLGVETSEDHPQETGVDVKTNWQRLIEKFKISTNLTLDELEFLTFKELENHIEEIDIKDGAFEFIGNLKDQGYMIGLATSTNWTIVDKIFEHFGMADFFDSVTTGEEVQNPKPAPDIYLLAAEKLGTEPQDCLVIEDSPSGVSSAVEANMKVIAISEDDDEDERLDQANLIVENFGKITPKVIDLL